MACKKCLLVMMICGLVIFARGGEKVRSYLTTGNWYPSSRASLESMLEGFFKKAEKIELPGKIRGLVAPHAGLVYSGPGAAAGFVQLEGIAPIRRVILLGVSHRGGFYGACVSDFSFNSTPLGKLEVDRGITRKLAGEKHFRLDNRIMQQEHSIENHLPFLQWVFKGKKIKIVPILFGGLERKDFAPMARIIGKHVDKQTLVVASTDFTHYGANFGYVPFGEDVKNNLAGLDGGMIDRVLDMDFAGYVEYKRKTGITMCGFTPVGVMMNIFPSRDHRGKLIAYYKSGDFNGDYSLSVSYASIVICRQELPPPGKGKAGAVPLKKTPELSVTEKKTLLTLARAALEGYFKEGGVLPKDTLKEKYRSDITDRLRKEAGVFVTLKKKGRLRGCIGSLVGKEPLYCGVMTNAVNAAVKDPRFSPLKKDELREIAIEISVMTPLEEIDNYKKIRLGTDGVIVKKGYRRAVFLPQVATETGWNLDTFLANLCAKAGLPADAYRSKDMQFFIFQALVFNEAEVKGQE